MKLFKSHLGTCFLSRPFLHIVLYFAVSVLQQSGLSKAKPVLETKWRMAPLLPGDQLLQTDSVEATTDPFRRTSTEKVIDLVKAAMASIPELGPKDAKTTLLRNTAIAMLKWLGCETLCTICTEDVTLLVSCNCPRPCIPFDRIRSSAL